MPSVLFINRVFPPARGATGYVLENMAKRLVDRGWKIGVVSATAGSRPSEGITIYSNQKLGRIAEKLPRAFGGYPMSLLAVLIGALRAPKHDIVVTMTDPPLVAAIGLLVGLLKGSKTVHWSQDVFPDVLESVAKTWAAKTIARILKKPFRYILTKYNIVLSIGDCMSKRLAEPKSIGVKAVVVRNPHDSTIRNFPRATDKLRQEFNVSGKFTVVYAGTAGKAHTFDTLFKVAEYMRETYPDISFVIVGAGSSFASLQETAKKLKPCNVSFISWVPDERLSEMLAVADVHIVTMADNVLGQCVPSKVAGIMAAARPCIFIGPSECDAADLIIRENCGKVVSNGSVVALANSIGHYYENSKLWEETSANALLAAGKYYDAAKLAKTFSDIMLSILKIGKAGDLKQLADAEKKKDRKAA